MFTVELSQGKVSVRFPDETVTTCAGCGANRLCRQYEGLFLCLTAPWNCYRHRLAIYANKQEKASV